MKNLLFIFLLSPLASFCQTISAEASSVTTTASADTLKVAYYCDPNCIPVVSYTWSKDSGPGTPTITGSMPAVVGGLSVGTYIFRVTAVNSNKIAVTDTVQFTVIPLNCDTTVKVTKRIPTYGSHIVYDIPRTVLDTSYVQVISDSVIKRTCVVGQPSAPVSIFSGTPPAVLHQSAGGIEVGVKFSAAVPGYITGIKYYNQGITGTITGEFYDSKGTRITQTTPVPASGTGWQTITLPAPVAITAGQTYTAAIFSSLGYYVSVVSDLSKPLTASGLTVPAGGGVYLYTKTAAYPTQTYSGSNYEIDVLFQNTK